MSQLNILMVASEVSPWAKSGGLADVTGALPDALAQLGHRVTTVVPRYRGLEVGEAARHDLTVSLGAVRYPTALHVKTVSEQQRLVFVDIPALFDRPGLYGTGAQDFADNADRFAVFTAAALDFAVFDTSSAPVDVIHAHDWQAALAPVLVRTQDRYRPTLGRAGLVFTIHNLSYQGVVDRDVVPRFGLPWSAFRMETGEYWGRFNFLKAGLTASDVVTTVSPTYARETLTPGPGAGLDGVLAALGDRYVGILNGIDVDTWNPSTDPLLPARFDAGDLAGKLVCKRALLERFGLPVGDDALARPVVALVGRLVSQKGLDLIRAAADELVNLDATWVFVGMGDPTHEQFLRDLAQRYPARVGVQIGFDEPLAHLVEAGADLFLMPSVFEPCGLNQMYSLRYGTVPVVTAVGGLDDTVQPYTARARHANGFKFRDQSPATLVRILKQALRLYQDRAVWVPLMERGMRTDHSWKTSAREYVKVYRRARQLAPARGSY
jgi:starch synthase